MAVKVLHTADWQIGKQFSELSDDSDKGALLRAQRLRTVERIAELAQEHEVDAVVVAGDVFETNAVSDETLRRTLGALAGYKGPWLLLPGNHDAALADSVWTRMKRLKPPSNVITLTTPEPQLVAEHRLAILPAPLTRRHEALDPTAAFDHMATPPGAVRIGVAHGSVSNRLPERGESINEIADDRAERARLDYLALGDWHGTQEIAPRTWYAGTPEPDRFRANDPGNILLVTIDEPGGPPQVEPIRVGHYRWHLLHERIYQRADLAGLEAAFAELGATHGTHGPHGTRGYDQHLVHLRLEGVLSLSAREALDRLIEEWSARFHVLRIDDSQLGTDATEEDIDTLESAGPLRATVERLRQILREPRHPEREHAGLALQLLYKEHLRVRG
ncbi:MAG: metallophosphoesterase [Polyangia bacterium]